MPKKTTAARHARTQQSVTGQKYTSALRAVRQRTPEMALVDALRAVGRTDVAVRLEEFDQERARLWLDPDPGPGADYLAFEWEQVLIESVLAALITAADAG